MRRHKAAWPTGNSSLAGSKASKKKASKKRQEDVLLGTDVTETLLPSSHVLRVSTKVAGKKLSTWVIFILPAPIVSDPG